MSSGSEGMALELDFCKAYDVGGRGLVHDQSSEHDVVCVICGNLYH